MRNFQIEPMRAEHWSAVAEIYLQGIATGNATFETECTDWANWNAKHHAHSRLVARSDEHVVGWAALSPVSTRRVYAGVAEVSIYVSNAARGLGLGKALLKVLIEQSEQNGIWTLQAGIFPENAASLRLHRSLEFREVGRREKIGQLRGVWRDVILLERRSRSTGGDARRS